jgi:hypothetical protein
MAREVGPRGVHVAHTIIDGQIQNEARGAIHSEAERGEDALLKPEAIGESYWQLHLQPRSARTHALALRPWVEPSGATRPASRLPKRHAAAVARQSHLHQCIGVGSHRPTRTRRWRKMMSVRGKAACNLATTAKPRVCMAGSSLALLTAALLAYALSV